jgi:hypothetical protein
MPFRTKPGEHIAEVHPASGLDFVLGCYQFQMESYSIRSLTLRKDFIDDIVDRYELNGEDARYDLAMVHARREGCRGGDS